MREQAYHLLVISGNSSSQGNAPVTQRDFNSLRNEFYDLRAEIDVRFETFRHDILGAFKDAVQVLSDKFDRQHEMFMNHEHRIARLETKVGAR